MFLSFLLYGGVLSSVVSRRLRLAGLAMAATALLWPARRRRAAIVESRLDESMPEWDFGEFHSIDVDAPPERIRAAIHAVTAREIRFFRALTTIRRCGTRGPEDILNAPHDEPLLDVATRTTFRYLFDEPDEIVVHTPIGPDIDAVMNFRIAGPRLTTETRVVCRSERSVRMFAMYWRAIHPGSDIIRRMWLRAIKRRAEPTYAIRRATTADIDAIERVMRDSLIGIGIRTYDARQIASSLEHIAHLDRDLVNDGTYFVAEAGGLIVGCGGWSRRSKLYAGGAASGDESRLLDPATEAARVRAMFVVPQWERRGIGRRILDLCEQEARAEGFRSVELMAMLSGRAMYDACGYQPLEDVEPPLADGTPLPLTRMGKTL